MMTNERETTRDESNELSRRSFLRRAGVAFAAVSVLDITAGGLAGCAVSNGARPSASQAPAESGAGHYTWQTVIVSEDEPGEPLVVSGRIFGPDGKTPAEGALLYVYHTDARGIYSEQDNPNGPPDPRLKGWMRTKADGRYEFRTIKPASYPNSRNPAHVHAKVSARDQTREWFDVFLFEGDPFITEAERSKSAGLGTFATVMAVGRGGDGVLRCVRDIKLARA